MLRALPEAVLLAGGLGTRLREVVADLPKALAPVAGRPFVAYLLELLAEAGIAHAVLATGHLGDQVERTIGHDWRGMRISYSCEERPLGTGGAVRRAAAQTEGGPLLVLNGDSYLHFDPQAFARAMARHDARIGIALAQVADVARYGAVETGEGRVLGFRGKGGRGPGWINAGVYYFSRMALEQLPQREAFSLESDVLLPTAAAGGVHAYTDTSGFIDIGVPVDYAAAQTLADAWGRR